jgi:uncharacterized Zn-finger protein
MSFTIHVIFGNIRKCSGVADCIAAVMRIGLNTEVNTCLSPSGRSGDTVTLNREKQMSSANQMIDDEAIPTTDQRVSCNGGGGPLGHPQVWLTLGTDGEVVCPYCSRRYVLAGTEDDA